MKSTLDVLGIIAGVGFLASGAGFLFLWCRDRKYPDQKKLGYGFVAIGAILVLARLMGLSL
jgi:hypothetical protein